MIFTTAAITVRISCRCFLSGGGSTDSFFVPENLPVGHLVGSLRVIGNADQDIDLSLINGSKVPVALSTSENGTSVLILTEPLDREGKLGPAGVAVSLLCTPRNSTQPGYTIPISIRSLSTIISCPLVLVRQDYLMCATLTHDCTPAG